MRTNEYRERLSEIDAELQRLTADYANRKFPDDVREQWNRLNAEREETASTVAELQAREKRLRDLASNPNATERANPSPSLLTRTNPWGSRGDDWRALGAPELRSRARDAATTQGNATAATLVHKLTAGTTWQSRQAAEHTLATSDPEYERAFMKVLANPVSGHRAFTTAEQHAYERAMALDPNSSGGHMTVPFQLDPTIMLSSDGSIDPYRQVARTVTISGTDTWKGVSSDGVTANWYAEGAEVSDDSPDVAGPEIPTHRASAWVEYSIELDQDSAQLRNELARLFQDAKVQLESQAFTSGTGSGQPTGVLTALGASETVLTGSAGSYGADDSYALVEAVPARFRSRTRVLASQPIINVTRRFTTDTEPEIVPATFDTWLGRPLSETSTLDDEVTAGAQIAVAGDFSQFVIVDRVGMSVELNPMVMGSNQRPRGRRGLFAHWRTGSDLLIPNALRVLEVAT